MADTLIPELCPRFHRASELIGRRWTGAIIFVLLKARCRFAALREAIPDITDRMLSERLQELEQEGIVERTVLPEAPVRVEYELTRKGRALATAVDAIAHWADKWVTVNERVAVDADVSVGRARPVRSTGRKATASARRRPGGRASRREQ